MNVMTNNELRPRLDKCLSAGGVPALFQLLQDWPVPELEGLREEVDEFFQAGTLTIAQHFSAEARNVPEQKRQRSPRRSDPAGIASASFYLFRDRISRAILP